MVKETPRMGAFTPLSFLQASVVHSTVFPRPVARSLCGPSACHAVRPRSGRRATRLQRRGGSLPTAAVCSPRRCAGWWARKQRKRNRRVGTVSFAWFLRLPLGLVLSSLPSSKGRVGAAAGLHARSILSGHNCGNCLLAPNVLSACKRREASRGKRGRGSGVN